MELKDLNGKHLLQGVESGSLSKWVCYVCNHIFDEPEIWHYRENLDDEQGIQDFYVPICPFCGAEGIQEETTEQEDEDDALD